MDGEGEFGALDSGQQQQGGHPAWNDMLAEIPQELHAKVTPHLQNWDKGVTERFSKVHQEYEPWKQITKNYDPETTQFALQMLSALENDPKTVYKAIGDLYHDQLGDLIQPATTPGQGQGEPNKDLEDKPWLQDVNQLRQENEMLAKILHGQRMEADNASADAQLDTELNTAKSKHGDYDERYVLGLISANPALSVDEAVQSWKESVQTYAEKMGLGGPKPFFMGGGSAIPGQNVDIKKATDAQTKDVVIQYLQAAAQQAK